MSDYDDTNRGALFKNDKKESDSHPDYKGTLNVAGQEFWVSSWIKTSKGGSKYMSLSVKPKDAPTQSREDQRKGERKRATEGPEPF